MKTIAEIADEYERNLVPLRQRRNALREQAKAEQCAELRCRLWHRVGVLDGMIYQGGASISVHAEIDQYIAFVRKGQDVLKVFFDNN